MSKCLNEKNCPFRKKKKLEYGLEYWIQSHFCEANPMFCARNMVADKLGIHNVPEYLYPTRQDQAQQILRDAQQNPLAYRRQASA